MTNVSTNITKQSRRVLLHHYHRYFFLIRSIKTHFQMVVSDSQLALSTSSSQLAVYNIQTNTTKLICAYPWHTGIPLADNRTEFLNQCLITNDHPQELNNLLMVRYRLILNLNDIHINLSNRHLRNKLMHVHCR